jgi:two-component system sensor histidine kinase/response regulator
MTAHTSSSERDRCLQAGMDGFLTKPLHASDLQAALATWLPPPDAQAPAAAPPGPGPVERPAPAIPRAALAELDVAGAMRRMEGDRETFELALLAFLASAPAEIAALDAAARAGDRERLLFAAHGLAGAAAGIGADPVRAAARHLEQVVQGRDAGALEVAVTDLIDRLDRLRGAASADGA